MEFDYFFYNIEYAFTSPVPYGLRETLFSGLCIVFITTNANSFMQKLLVPGLLVLVSILIFLNCTKENGSTDYLANADCSTIDETNNTYTKTIKSILDSQCATSGCHDAFSQSENIDLSTYGTAKTAFQNAQCLCSIHHGAGCKAMPDGGSKLSDATIQKIDCWAKNGYQQ